MGGPTIRLSAPSRLVEIRTSTGSFGAKPQSRARQKLMRCDGVTLQWIATTRPKVVVVSVGASNSYDHPDPGALRYYGVLGAAICRTDMQGTLEVAGASDGTFEVTTEQ